MFAIWSKRKRLPAHRRRDGARVPSLIENPARAGRGVDATNPNQPPPESVGALHSRRAERCAGPRRRSGDSGRRLGPRPSSRNGGYRHPDSGGHRVPGFPEGRRDAPVAAGDSLRRLPAQRARAFLARGPGARGSDQRLRLLRPVCLSAPRRCGSHDLDRARARGRGSAACAGRRGGARDHGPHHHSDPAKRGPSAPVPPGLRFRPEPPRVQLVIE